MDPTTTAPRPATSHVLTDSDDSASETDTRSIAPGGTTHHKQVKSKSTQGRNRGDLPKRYNAPPDTRFNDRFLPEVQHLYGLEPDPWSHLSVALIQRVRDKIFTEFQDMLTTKSAVFRNVRSSALFIIISTKKEVRQKPPYLPGDVLYSRRWIR
jgi:hypothetical protein